MAQIDTSLIMASVPQIDIAGTLGSAIQGYYGVKEMENSLKEQNMLLEQRENELWSSNYNKWKEYGNFVTPDNIDDYISKGKEMGIYDDEDAKAMRESFDDMGGVGYFDELRGKMETASGHQKAIADLEAEKAQLASQAEELGGLDTPIAYQQQEQINQRVAEIDNEIAQNMEPLKGLNPNALMQEYQAANEAIQGRMSIWRGMGNAEQAIKAGDVVTRYRRNPETGEVEAMTAYTSKDLDGLYENGYIYEDSSDVPTAATEEEEKQLTTGVGLSGAEEIVLIGKETGKPTWTGVKTGGLTESESKKLASVSGMDLKEAPNPNTGAEEFVYMSAGQEPIWTGIPTGQLTGQKAAALNMIMDDIIMRSTFNKLEPEDKMSVLSDAQFVIESANPELQGMVTEYMDAWETSYKDIYPDKNKFLQAVIEKYKERL